MADKTRTDLLREIRQLSERLREQDRLLARFKEPATRSRLPANLQGKPRSAATSRFMSPEFADWFVDAIEALLPCPAGIVELDAAGLVHAVHGRACEALGVARDELIGTPWEQLLSIEDRGRWRTTRAAPEEPHIETSLSFRLRSDIGCANLVAVVLRLPGQKSPNWIVLTDRSAEPSAMAAEMAAKRWAGIFAHELNQPLAAVLTTAQACRSLLASGTLLPEEMTQGMDGLIRRVHHAADLVRRLRTMAGGEPPRRLPADLKDVVRRALEVLQGPIADSDTAVAVDIAHDFPSVKIDAVQIVQVIVNLVRNAIEAMSSLPVPRRQLTVRAQFDSREAIVAVEDRGVGLSVDVIERLFQPYASTKATGMGLGLALCRQIVEAHGGRIWVKGNVPSGCVFSFSFPLLPEEP